MSCSLGFTVGSVEFGVCGLLAQAGKTPCKDGATFPPRGLLRCVLGFRV